MLDVFFASSQFWHAISNDHLTLAIELHVIDAIAVFVVTAMSLLEMDILEAGLLWVFTYLVPIVLGMAIATVILSQLI